MSIDFSFPAFKGRIWSNKTNIIFLLIVPEQNAAGNKPKTEYTLILK